MRQMGLLGATIGDVVAHKTAMAASTPPPAKPRDLATIAMEIMREWKKPYFGAVPYINAMRSLGSIEDRYGQDSAVEIVDRFLSNATSWRGDAARRIKAELKAMRGKRSW